jgi:hypothetical protein
MQQLLKREGPRYQYGSGCLSDGVIGAWMARIYGIETPLARKNVRSNLQAIFKNNFKTDLSEHANAQRPGYAMGREPGLLLCSWPQGRQAYPALFPIPTRSGPALNTRSPRISFTRALSKKA